MQYEIFIEWVTFLSVWPIVKLTSGLVQSQHKSSFVTFLFGI